MFSRLHLDSFGYYACLIFFCLAVESLLRLYLGPHQCLELLQIPAATLPPLQHRDPRFKPSSDEMFTMHCNLCSLETEAVRRTVRFLEEVRGPGTSKQGGGGSAGIGGRGAALVYTFLAFATRSYAALLSSLATAQ